MKTTAALLLLTVSLFSITTTPSTAQQRFKCTTNATTCQALVGYIPTNTTTLSKIQTLFTIKHLSSLLGANSLPLSTLKNQTVPANQTIKIPFPCICINGTGISNRVPIYKVKKDDGLYHIAAEVFGGLLTFQQIVNIPSNNISNPDRIETGQELWVPLPCSCDEVDGEKVVHYGHIVAAGSSVAQIAEEFGTNQETLLRLNGIADPKDLKAAEVLDVPLRACNSSVNSSSLDYPLLLSNNTYTLTANNCVQCKCDASNNWILNCEPSQGVTNSSACPPIQCEDNSYLGNTTSSSGCRSTICAYAGYTSQRILTTLATETTCPATPATQSPGNSAPKNGQQRWSSWRSLLVSLDLGLLCFGLLW